jgi:hypothetical protein
VSLVGQLGEDRLSDVVVAAPVGGPLRVCELVDEVPAALFSVLVVAGITATNGRPSRRAKYASLIAVEPLLASMIVVPSQIQPLTSAYRNSERASRCLSEPVGCTDSSLR